MGDVFFEYMFYVRHMAIMNPERSKNLDGG